MSSVQRFSRLLCCRQSKESQSKEIENHLLLDYKVTAIALAAFSVLIGTLILCKVPKLSQLGNTAGWTLTSLGSLVCLTAVSSHYKKNQSTTRALNKPVVKTNGSQLEDEESKLDQVDPIESNQPENDLKIETAELTPQQRILNDFTPQMVEALGGIDRVLMLPVLENWNNGYDLNDMKAPVMRGYDSGGNPFLTFCYLRFSIEYNEYGISGECFSRKKTGQWWTEGVKQLNLGMNTIDDNTLAAHHMLDKIARLMRREAVGVITEFPGVMLFKPEDKELWRPKDAYLENEELEQFMDLNTTFYERKPKENATELFLYNPNLTRAKNLELLYEQFPASKIS